MSLQNQVLASLRKILQPVVSVPNLAIPVTKICELVVAPQCCAKLNKQGNQHARKILNDVCEKENSVLVAGYLEGRIEKALTSMITILRERCSIKGDKGPDLEQGEHFKRLIDETQELLKLSSGVQKFKNANICR